jgi:hypothetical protein
MAIPENATDANFFNLIHQMAVTTRGNAPVDRRGCRREPFRVLQRVALRHGRDIPDEANFVEVQCYDLTQGGFSFLLPSRPNFERLVVAFGAPPEAIYLGAEVAHCDDVTVDGFSDGRGQAAGDPTAIPMVLVGCRFTDRLKR